MIKVILDPAHAKLVKGKRSPDNRIEEWNWSREILGEIETRLDEIGIPHERTSYSSEDSGDEIGLTTRCKRANAIAKSSEFPCIFVSMHINAAGNGEWKNARGWSVFVSPNSSSKSRMLADLMANSAKNRSISVRQPDHVHSYWTANFTVLTKTSMPAVLVENLFMDNKADVEILESKEGKERLRETIIEAICLYAGIEYN